MTLSPDQATDSLKEIEKIGRRSAQAFSYANSSPYFLVWGVIWILGYGGTDLLARNAMMRQVSPLWLALTAIGLAGCWFVGSRQYRHRPRADQAGRHGRSEGLRFFGAFAVIALFVEASTVMMGHTTAQQQAGFIPLVVAMFYAIMGLWGGARFLVTGLALTALTLAGYYFLRDYYFLWMAAVGGGALILAGLWLRKV